LTSNETPILSAVGVTFGFPQRPDFLKPVSLDVHRGDCVGIIGPNGAGKSTLLRLLAGLMLPQRGTIRFEGRSLVEIPLRDRARSIAFLPQHTPKDVPNSVQDIVLMGRFPYRQFGLFENAADFEIARSALATTQTARFADRALSTLSGGEAQRVHLAAALAQQPKVLLLDEPTAALDLHHQLVIFALLRDLTRQEGLAVVVVTHDLNLAARFCSNVLLLDDGRTVASGPPDEVIAPDRLEPVYAVKLAEWRAPGDLGRWIVPLRPTEGSA
jgi:iron complex transport system ATP-binding protein